jgi:hypothetical protein
MFCTRQLKWRLWRAGAGSERQPWEAPSRVGQRGLMFPGRITDARARSYWQALSMGMLPKLGGSNLVRTDFADSAAWEQASNEAQQENADGFRAYIEPVSDPAFDGLSWEAVKAAVPADDDEGAVLFIADATALASHEHPILVVDLLDNRPPFRCIPSQL